MTPAEALVNGRIPSTYRVCDPAGMALATLFVTMPFVARELIPILEAMDLSQEEAARTLGASNLEVFWNVTLPNIRWGLMYGIILTNAVCFLRMHNLLTTCVSSLTILEISIINWHIDWL